MNVRSTRQCIDKPQQKYVPLSDRNSVQIHTGKEVKRRDWSRGLIGTASEEYKKKQTKGSPD